MSNFLNFRGNSGVTFKSFTASGGTTYTLDKSASTNSVLVSVGGVLQKPSTDYSVSGTTLTTTSTVTTGIVIDTYIIHDAGNAPVVEDNSIVTAKIADSQITRGKLDLISTSSEAGATIKGDGTTDGYIQLNCSQNSHGIKLKSPAHSAGASYTLVLPTTDGNADEFLQTNGSGVTTWAAAGLTNYGFAAARTTDQTVASGAFTKIQFDTETYDPQSDYDNSTNYRYTPSSAGYYIASTSISFYNSNGAAQLQVKLYKNGSEFAFSSGSHVQSGGYGVSVSFSHIVQMNGSSDYIEVYALHNDTASKPIWRSLFSAWKVGVA